MKATRPYSMSVRAASQRDTRRRILDAARTAFFDERYEEATLALIAAAAGVSHQTVLNHFESKEGLLLAVGADVGAEIAERRGPAEPSDARDSVARLVADYEAFGDANARFDALAERFPEVARLIDGARGLHRAWLEGRFGPWLEGLPAPERRRRLALLEVATNVHTWTHLRRHCGFGRRATGELMLRMVEAAVAATDDEPEEAP